MQLESAINTNGVYLYSHCVKAEAGFSTEVDSKAANMTTCPEWHKLVIVLLDEVHIKENLVFDKHSGKNGWIC